MKFLVQVNCPHEPFSTYVKDGTAGQRIQKILGELKPEAVYFTEFDGLRSAVVIVNIDDASKIPTIAEPWFLTFNADVRLHPVMTPEDLGKSGIDKIGNKWS